MKVWTRLYIVIWLTFIQFLLAFAASHLPLWVVDLHFLVGVLVLGFAHWNRATLSKSNAPKRLKRIATATAVLATVQPLLGLPLYLNLRVGVGVPLGVIIQFAHLVNALALLSQSSSTATAYDMWEEKEF